ncbi:MAG TPA: hypothetical protein VKU60_21055 [Chloroflexota bacterium]|nr:hypothetical protein [Chloroflexota bacterium]
MRELLGRVNVALSELASVEYPGELERGHIDTVCQLIEQLRDIGQRLP